MSDEIVVPASKDGTIPGLRARANEHGVIAISQEWPGPVGSPVMRAVWVSPDQARAVAEALLRAAGGEDAGGA